MKKITLLLLLVVVLFTWTINAQITPTGLWYPIGDVTISTVTDDGDNGDGVGDGALFIDGVSAVVGQGISFRFSGTMESGMTYAIESYMYNLASSFSKVRVSLYNATDNTELAVYADGGTVLNGSNQIERVVFNYTTMASDVGDKLELRYIRNDDGGLSRNFNIDNASLNGIYLTEVAPTVSVEGTWGAIGNTELSFLESDPDNGDGENDGAYYIDGKDTIEPQGAKYSLSEAMVEGMPYRAETTIYNKDNSYCKMVLQLYNVSDNRVLATSSELFVNGIANTNNVASGNVTYTAEVADAGDILEIRFLRSSVFDTYRNFVIDIAKLNGTPINISSESLSVSEAVLNSALNIYPNPANQYLFIKTNNSNLKFINISLFNIVGKKVYTTNTIAHPINVSTLSKGIYILSMTTLTGNSLIKKIVVD